MCWSGEASFTLAACGFTGAYFAAKHNHPLFRYLPLIYFSLMEILQGITYSVIGQCSNEFNINLTVLSYLHIAFQPFFANMFYLSFQPKEVQKKAWWIWIVSGLASMVMMAMWLNPDWPSKCSVMGQSICGAMTCSYHGNWHIAWKLKLSSLDPHYFAYGAAVFIAPLFYGAWRAVLYHMLFGPLLMFLLSNNKDEQPAIWCLLSIGLLLGTHVKFINNWLSVPIKEVQQKKNGAI